MQLTPNDANESESDEEALPQRLTHDVSHIPDYPTRTLRSGLRRDAPGGGSASAGRNGGGGGNAMIVLDDDAPPVAWGQETRPPCHFQSIKPVELPVSR